MRNVHDYPHYDETSSGIRFQVLLDPITDQGVPQGRSMSILAQVPWEDSELFVRDVIGYTSWTSGPTLTRVLPLQCFWFPELYCDQFELIDSGCSEQQDSYAEVLSGWPIKDWCLYRLRFSRPVYAVSQLGEGPHEDGAEAARYVSVRRAYLPRERRMSGWGYVYDKSPTQTGEWEQVPDEAVFLPEHTMRVVATWHQIPENAVPWDAMTNLMGAVNADPVTIADMTFEAEKLLFRGLQDQIERYQGPNGTWYYDLPYVFEYRPAQYGWNGYTLPQINPNGTRKYGRVRRKVEGVDPDDCPPVYGAGDFPLLFTPGGTLP